MNGNREASYAVCCAIARRTAKNFYYSFLVMPAAKRQAMCAIYAFMRRSDDIADDAASPAVALEELRQWRAQVTAAFGGSGTGVSPVAESSNTHGRDARATNFILPALVDTVRRYRIPEKCFFELLDGTEMDQTINRYATFDELYRYCYRVASCVGLVVLPIFGYKDEAALAPAEACGIAFQLTNILRDVKEDAERGRIYLPGEDLRRFGVTEADILSGRSTPGFVELMKFEAARAAEFYRKAEPLLTMIDADSRGTLAVMMGIYGGILKKIVARNYAVLDGRIGLTAAEKMWIVLKNWRKH